MSHSVLAPEWAQPQSLSGSKNMKNGAGFPVGLAVGISIGTAVGVATGNIGLWLPLGVAIGAALGMSFSATSTASKQDKTDEGETPNKED